MPCWELCTLMPLTKGRSRLRLKQAIGVVIVFTSYAAFTTVQLGSATRQLFRRVQILKAQYEANKRPQLDARICCIDC